MNDEDNRPAVAVPVQGPVMQHTPGPWKAVYIGCGDWDLEGPVSQQDWALAAEAPNLRNALQSLLRHAERQNEVLAQECGVRFVDSGPLDMARDALKRDVGDA